MDNFFMYKKAVRAMDEINRVMEGKGHTVHQIMTAILAGGHILIEDIPGTGKTTVLKVILYIHQALCRSEVQLMAPTGRAARRMVESTGCIHDASGPGAFGR